MNEKTEIRSNDSVAGMCYFGLILAVIILMYHFCGVTVYKEINGDSLYIWLYYAWTNASADGLDSSYSFLVPLVSLYVIFINWKDIRNCPREGYMPAGLLVAVSLGLHWVGMKAQIPHISVLSLICLLYSSVLFLYGRRIGSRLMFPFAYMLFCVPMSFMDFATLPLRMWATKAAVLVVNGIGIGASSVGTTIMLAGQEGMGLDVAAPCSGMRSLFVIMALASAYAYLFCSDNRVRWSIFLFSIPLALILNVLRISSIAVVASLYSRDAALRYFHDVSGYIVIILAVLMLFGIRTWLYKTFKIRAEDGDAKIS